MHALVVSYEMAMAEITELRRLEWGVMVVDEGHRLKNPTSRLFRARTRHHSCCHRENCACTHTSCSHVFMGGGSVASRPSVGFES